MRTVKYENNYEDAKKIRTEVFIQEQGFQEEFDEKDSKSVHVTIYVDNEIVGCARMFYDEDKTIIHLGRIALRKKFRNQGLGRYLMECCEKYYEGTSVTSFTLGAQCRKQGFYEKLGYQPIGEIFDDEGVPHIQMIKRV